MRTLIDIPEEHVKALAEISQQQALSRAEVVRRAIAAFIALHHRGVSLDEAFGLWQGRDADGRAYQKAQRAEWER